MTTLKGWGRLEMCSMAPGSQLSDKSCPRRLDCTLEQMAEEVRVYFSAETMSKPNKYDIYFRSNLEYNKCPDATSSK